MESEIKENLRKSILDCNIELATNSAKKVIQNKMDLLEAIDVRPGEADDQGGVRVRGPKALNRLGAAPGVYRQHCVT